MKSNTLFKIVSLATILFVASIYSMGQVNPTITLTDVTNPTLITVKGTPVVQTLNVSGVNLNVDLGLAISGTDAGLFSLSQYTVTETGGTIPNTVVTITYNPNGIGSNTAYLTMSSTGAMPVVRTLNGVSSLTTDVNSPTSNFTVFVENSHLCFYATAGETVEIFNAIGQKLVQRLALDGLNSVPVAVHGILLVKVGSKVSKVIL